TNKELLMRGLAVPFSYKHDSRNFVVGEQLVAMADLPTEFGGISASQEPSVESAESMFENEPLVHIISEPIMLPRMYDWLNDKPDGLFDETAEVMQDVFAELNPDKNI